MAIRILLVAFLFMAFAADAVAQAGRRAACGNPGIWQGLWSSRDGGSSLDIRSSGGGSGTFAGTFHALSDAMRLTDHRPGQTAIEATFDCDRFTGRMLLTANGRTLTKLFYDCSWNGYFVNVSGRLTAPDEMTVTVEPFMIVKTYGGCRTLYPGPDRAEYDVYLRGGNWVVLSAEPVVKVFHRG